MISRELIDFLIVSGCNAAISAGKEIMNIYNASEVFDVNINADNTVVTEADRVAHETIKKSLASTRIPIMSEEGRNILYEERYSWDLYWLVDPLDGTREFIQKNDEFVVCIALMQNNKPLLGIIYIPTEDTIYFSDPDRGAFKIVRCSSNCSTVKSIQDLFKSSNKLDCRNRYGDSLKIVITRSHINESTKDLIDLIRKNHNNIEIINCGSCKKFCMIADGTADVYFRTTSLFDWDIAAGEAIANAAGATTTTLERKEIEYNKQELVIEPFITSSKNIIIQ